MFIPFLISSSIHSRFDLLNIFFFTLPLFWALLLSINCATCLKSKKSKDFEPIRGYLSKNGIMIYRISLNFVTLKSPAKLVPDYNIFLWRSHSQLVPPKKKKTKELIKLFNNNKSRVCCVTINFKDTVSPILLVDFEYQQKKKTTFSIYKSYYPIWIQDCRILNKRSFHWYNIRECFLRSGRSTEHRINLY